MSAFRRRRSALASIATFVTYLAVSFSAFFALAAPAFAQQENVPLENTPTGWFFRYVNSAIVIGVIAYFLIKKGGPAFRKRADEIESAIAEGTRTREEAERRRREADERLAGLDAEINALRAQAKRDAEAETARIRGLTRDEVAKIDRAAELEIAAVERAARMELKAHAARLAVERAETLLRQEITPRTDFEIVRTFVTDLTESRN
ncbi:MAG: hypothetical protein WA755_08590 [Candidatus Acidiferrales bacterium]